MGLFLLQVFLTALHFVLEFTFRLIVNNLSVSYSAFHLTPLVYVNRCPSNRGQITHANWIGLFRVS